jgi:hypothetical protein
LKNFIDFRPANGLSQMDWLASRGKLEVLAVDDACLLARKRKTVAMAGRSVVLSVTKCKQQTQQRRLWRFAVVIAEHNMSFMMTLLTFPSSLLGLFLVWFRGWWIRLLQFSLRLN